MSIYLNIFCRRAKEEEEFLKVTKKTNRRKSSSVGVLNAAPDVLGLSDETQSRILTFRKSLGLSTNSGDSRFRSTISNIFGRQNDDNYSRDLEIGSTILSTSDPNLIRAHNKRVKFIKSKLDFTPVERRKWEFQQLQEQLDFMEVVVNAAPVQLVEKTPLSDVHSLFTMVGIYTAYVTKIGKLVGVVGLTELKQVIDNVNSGNIERYCSIEDLSEDHPPAETPLLDRLDRIQFQQQQSVDTYEGITTLEATAGSGGDGDGDSEGNGSGTSV